MRLYDEHKNTLEDAIKAIHERSFFSRFPEHPSPAIYGEDADSEGRKRFQELLGKRFENLRQSAPEQWLGVEESPYLQEPLGIEYPAFSLDTLIERAHSAYHKWRKVTAEERAGILIESLEKIKEHFFEIAYATMHTTGQGYMMAFQASGPHAADRALEAIATGYEELKRFPDSNIWDKPMGKYNLRLSKSWRAVPKGISLVIGCSTFPTWNSVPGMFASLITGNPVIVKPHPGAVLPVAFFVAEIQRVLSDNGHDPNICQLAVDTYDDLIAKDLAEHPLVKLIDYTGSAEFGNYLETLKGKEVFTEKTGVNSVIIDSVEDVDKVVQNLAFSVSLYSGQMCTAPQNLFIPQEGIQTKNGKVTFEEFAQKFVDAINGLAENQKAGPFVFGAVQNKSTTERVNKAGQLEGEVLLRSRNIENPLFENARTATPTVIALDASRKEVFSAELFGPIVFLIKTLHAQESIALAKEMAIRHGAISCGAYTVDKKLKEKIADEMSLAATPVSFNLTGGIYVNQNAAFSDFHVTGGNPAGNASFTNPEYAVKRFTWVGFREPAVD